MANSAYKQHAAQLKALQVLKLGIEVHNPKVVLRDDFELGEFSIENGRSDFDEDASTINVRMRIRAGRFAAEGESDPERKALFEADAISLVVEVAGVFSVDVTQFPAEYIHDWAEKNAPLVIYPYVREQVYGLSSRVGIKAVLLPLLEIPTFKLTAQ